MPELDNPNNRLRDLIEKYIANTCTRKELEQLLVMIENETDTEAITQTLKDHWETSGQKNALRESELDVSLLY